MFAALPGATGDRRERTILPPRGPERFGAAGPEARSRAGAWGWGRALQRRRCRILVGGAVWWPQGESPAMCMVVYIASDYPLPTSSWDEARPRFHVTELSERDEPVRRQFSKPCAYYAGSHEGCGCGFQYGEYPGYQEEAAA